MRAVATDGHRLAQIDLPLPKGAAGMPGVIVPRKTVGEVQRLIEDNEAEVEIELSQGKIRFTIGNVVLTSKLIDGTFPDYGRVIPQNNDKELIVDKKDFEAAVDRVSTISSERGRAVKLALSAGKLVLSVTNPDSGSATEELEVEYASDALDIGFNSRYLLDIAAQIEGEVAVLQARRPRLADAGAGQGFQRRALRADADAGVRLSSPASRQFAWSCPSRPSVLGSTGRRIARHDPDHDPLPHPSPHPDAFPQLSRGEPCRRAAMWWCWWGRTAPARPIASRRSRFCRRDAACAAPRWTTSPTIQGDGSWAVSAEVEGALGLATLGTGIDAPGSEAAAHQPALPDRPRAGELRRPPSAIICAWCG